MIPNPGHVSQHLRLWWLRIYLILWILEGGAFQPTDVKRTGRCETYMYLICKCHVNAYKRSCGSVIHFWVSHFGPGPIDRLFLDPWRNPWQNNQLQLWRGHGSLAMKSVFKQEANKQPLNLHHMGFITDLQWQACENYLYIPWSIEKSLYLRWKWQGTWWLGTA